MEKEMEHRVKSVFAIGDNIISSLGFSTQENVDAMLQGKTGIRLMSDTTIYPEDFQAGSIDKERLAQLRQKHEIEHFSIFESLVILSIIDSLQSANIEIDHSKTILVLSTTKGNIDFLNTLSKEELESKESTKIQEALLWKSAQNIAQFFNIQTEPIVVSNACVSGVSAIEIASKLLRKNNYENAIVAGADLIAAFTVSGFQSFKSISSAPCKPYDIERDGLSIGEGAGSIILTNNEENVKQEQTVCILGGATANDANHISGPSRTGDGLHYAIENAILQAGIEKNDIDFMNLHGTATVFNDEMESKAVALSQLSKVPASSFKGYFGHTLGASGIIEIIACIASLRRNQLILTLGFSQLGVPEEMNIITENTYKELHTFLKTASGFGGFNSAIVISNKYKSKPIGHQNITVNVSTNCQIEESKIMVDDEVVYELNDAENLEIFLKLAFKNLSEPNMKFYKMDNLCKLGYLGVEYLLKNNNLLDKYDRTKIALVFNNSFSSLDTDINHQLTIIDKENYFPSPAIFVYTLPNIVLGEVCIKQKIQGETNFFVSEKYNQTWLQQYAKLLFETTSTQAAIIGWVDCLGSTYNVSLSLLEKVIS